MTVRELIYELHKYDENMKIIWWENENGFDTAEILVGEYDFDGEEHVGLQPDWAR